MSERSRVKLKHALAGVVGLALVALMLNGAAAPAARAAEATVAVAANFAEPVETLAKMFGEKAGHSLTIVTGSTGKLYAQITNGAPFDVLLAADQERPERLAKEGQGEAGSVFTYAIGRLTLWSPDPAMIAEDGAATLRAGQVPLPRDRQPQACALRRRRAADPGEAWAMGSAAAQARARREHWPDLPDGRER